MGLAAARDEARRWRMSLAAGKDPGVEQARERRKRQVTFADVANEYIADVKRRGLRRAHEAEREIKRELVSRWGSRAICDIDRADVLQALDETMARSHWQSHHVFSYASRIFSWALERDAYGLERSPCDRLRPSKVIGPKEPRTRILSDAELRAVWHACPDLGFPFGPLVRLLILTGQRRSEVAEARWNEFNGDLWTIPHQRQKMKTTHVVPLVPEVIALLDGLPRFDRGDYVFTTTFGARPVSGFSKAKTRLDKLLNAKMANWTLHDLRRSMRTNLSALPVPDLVRELVIGHTKPGLHKVYDQHKYIEEKRLALKLWTERLLRIVG
jgi:integrase